jgi:hypothetical protein
MLKASYQCAFAALFASCSAFDTALDYAEIAGRVAVQIEPTIVKPEQLAKIEAGLEIVRAASAAQQGKVDETAKHVEAAQDRIEAVEQNAKKEDDDVGLAFWLGVAGVAAAGLRGVPSKGPVRAVVDALTPKKTPAAPAE